jgi:hypothetical protein
MGAAYDSIGSRRCSGDAAREESVSALLAQILFTALAFAVPATASVFVGRPRRPRLRGPYRALLAAGVVAAAALVLGAVAGSGAGRTGAVAVVLGVVVLAFGPVGRPWTLRGLVAWSSTVAAGASYLVLVLVWTAQAGLGVVALLGGAVLWLVELLVCVLALGCLWELVDLRARWDWQRRAELRGEVEAGGSAQVFGGRRPFVSLHVPIHAEPPDVVVATLESLVALDYDGFEVLVVDNGTHDAERSRPVERFCRAHERLGFFRLEDAVHRAGALNHALDKVDPRTELVGVVDADCLVGPDLLARCVPLFERPRVAFVQTQLDDRDTEVAAYFRRLHRFRASSEVAQRSRNERNDALLGGGPGLVRRDALVGVGGWDEWCVTEDAELGLRLLRAGWSGAQVEHAFARGTVPVTFEALKRQRFRSCFGAVQLLRLHWRALLPGRRTEENALTPGQRWAYLAGGVQWFGGLARLLLTGFLLVAAVDALIGDGAVLRRFSAPLLVAVVAVVLLGLLRSVALVGRTAWRRPGETLGALGIGLALGWVDAHAAARGLVAQRAASLRTPVVRGDATWRDSVRGNVVETLLALACVIGAAVGFGAATTGGVAVGVLLLLLAVGYAAAPVNSLAAMRADLTPELRARRREVPPWTPATASVRRRGIGPVIAAGAVAAAALLVVGPVGAPRLDDLSGEDGSEPAAGTARPQPAATPSSAQQSLVAMPPLSPLSSLLTPAPPTSARDVVAGPSRPGGTGPSAPGSTSAPVATPTPTPSKAHGRPTWLPPKPSPTKRHH